jgi:uncharacterized membrane protein
MNLRHLFAMLLALAASPAVGQQSPATVTVRVESAGAPVEAARVSVADTAGLTDAAGKLMLRLEAGSHRIHVEAFGFEAATQSVVLRPGADTTVVIVFPACRAPVAGSGRRWRYG